MASPPFKTGSSIQLPQQDLFTSVAARRGTTRKRMHELTVSALSGPYLRPSEVGKVAAALRDGVEQGIADLGESSGPVREEAYAGLALGLREVIIAFSIAYQSYLRHQALLSASELGLLATSLHGLADQLAEMRQVNVWPNADLGLTPLDDLLEDIDNDLARTDLGIEPIASWSRSLCREMNEPETRSQPKQAFEPLFGLVAIGVLQGLRALPDFD